MLEANATNNNHTDETGSMP